VSRNGLEKRLLKIVVWYLVSMPIMLIALFTFSAEDFAYLSNLQLMYPEIKVLFLFFILFYGTPIYILVFIFSKIANMLKFEILQESLQDLEKIASIPLYIFGFGFYNFYFKLKNIDYREEKQGVRLITANVIGAILLLGFEMRIFEHLLFYMIILTVFFGILSLVWRRLFKQSPQASFRVP